MLTDEQFAGLVALPYETREVAFKPPGPRTDAYLFAQVTRAALGMANQRGGGFVIIGMEQQSSGATPRGLSVSDLATWRYDDVAARFASYADPALDFALTVHHYQGKQFVLLEIEEFEQVPVLCKLDYQVPPSTRHPNDTRVAPLILRAGACYVRSRRKPETVEIPTQTEMREVLDLAIEKGLRRYLDQARRIGLLTPAILLPGEGRGFGQEQRNSETRP